MSFDVYNLKFRSCGNEMTIGGYRFSRAADYGTQIQNLQHMHTTHSEFTTRRNTGTHCITGHVALPDQEAAAVIHEGSSDATALDDITLLLSIFTTRHVIVCRNDSLEDEPRVIIADPRIFIWGGVISTSIPYVKSLTPRVDRPTYSDEGLEIHLNKIHQLINTDDWRKKYHNGFYLKLFREALQHRTVESAFTQCWTIWEHLFSILNESWMTRDTIQRINSMEKIAFLLVTYAVRENLKEKEKKRLKSLVDIRNRLVHFGRFPESDSVREDAILFISLTELIVAKTLELKPSEIFNTSDRLESFLKNATKTT